MMKFFEIYIVEVGEKVWEIVNLFVGVGEWLINKVGVIGVGMMGGGIIMNFVLVGIFVIIVEIK